MDRVYHEADVIRAYRRAVPVAMCAGVVANLQAFMALALAVDSGRYPSLTRFLNELKRYRALPISPNVRRRCGDATERRPGHFLGSAPAELPSSRPHVGAAGARRRGQGSARHHDCRTSSQGDAWTAASTLARCRARWRDAVACCYIRRIRHAPRQGSKPHGRDALRLGSREPGRPVVTHQ